MSNHETNPAGTYEVPSRKDKIKRAANLAGQWTVFFAASYVVGYAYGKGLSKLANK